MVVIPVRAKAAATPSDSRNHEAAGRLISCVPAPVHAPLAKAIAEMKANARVPGLSDAGIDSKLAAHNADRRAPAIIDGSSRRLGTALARASEFGIDLTLLLERVSTPERRLERAAQALARTLREIRGDRGLGRDDPE